MSATPQSRIRIGIDVGGTFTDAVAVDAATGSLLGQVKRPTTHDHTEGVAAGIIEALHRVLEQTGHHPDDVNFLAHGTTQATNALLEGDVATVGVVGVGTGFAGWRVRSLATLARLSLVPGKTLPVVYAHAKHHSDIPGAVQAVREAGAEVVVGVQAFSVDDPRGERAVLDAARVQGMLATASHEISKLYGLRKRARTAVINASILPRMLQTAELVEKSIHQAGISAPLMVMRCDGGVMSLAEMRRRPLLTILSGPAAGVAGALMSEHVSDGIFLETGGTSTDISVIRNGSVAIQYAKVAGHDTYLRALDVRTVGVGGGSLIRVGASGVLEVGPRSAHIAGAAYACFTDSRLLEATTVTTTSPKPGDPDDYAVYRIDDGHTVAPTVTCAANALGLVPVDDYAHVPREQAQHALTPLARHLHMSVDTLAHEVLKTAAKPVQKVVDALVADYGLDKELVRLVGGGGGGATLCPYVAQDADLRHALAAHAPVISPVGVALALVRESVERVVPQPSEHDVLAVRGEAEAAVLAQGADAATVAVDVSVDAQRNIIAAVATGSTELRSPASNGAAASDAEAEAAASLQVSTDALTERAATDHFRVLGAPRNRRGLHALLNRTPRQPLRVVDGRGVIRFQSTDATVRTTDVAAARNITGHVIDDLTVFGDGGSQIPAVRLLVGGRIVNLSGLPRAEQVLAMLDNELAHRHRDEDVVILAEARS
jgi:N-methylhydantoinase A/oxoprolinase/acetone carboxylase beta subunit